MRVGISLETTTIPHQPTGESLIRLAEQAEQAGFATLVLADHFSLRPESLPFIRQDESAPTPVVMDLVFRA